MARRYKKENEYKKMKKISIGMWILFVIMSIYLISNIVKTNMLPGKYLTIGIGVVIIIALLILLAIAKKKRGFKMFIVLDIIMILVSFVEIYTGNKINTLNTFLDKQLGVKYMTNVYTVLVNSNSTYNSLSDIANKNVYYLSDDENDEVVITNIKNNINNAKVQTVNDVDEVFENLQKNKQYISVMNSGRYDAVISNDEEIEKKVKIIGNFEITTEVESKDTNIDITKDPFIILINGIDTRSGKMPARSLSDVNIIMAVNPKTKRILMIHVPRDYYVAVSGKNGAKDKLTHTGSIGGVALTTKTIEELLEIEIPYYIRANFVAVENLVDAIDGIDVYSDVDYSFHSYNIPALVIKPGYNHLNGREALAFAKERHAYKTGDEHRGQNQEQVIKCVINKMISSKTMLGKFDSILSSLSGTFETNLTSTEISSVVKMQINDMASWTMEECNLTGTNSSEYTYSYPKQKLYVMFPDQTSIDTAINKLNEILEEN